MPLAAEQKTNVIKVIPSEGKDTGSPESASLRF